MKAATFAILIGLQVIDVASTLYALKLGAKEANPLVAKAMAWFDNPLVALLVLKGAVIGLVAWQYDIIHVGVLAALCAFYVWVIWNNWSIIRKLRGSE